MNQGLPLFFFGFSLVVERLTERAKLLQHRGVVVIKDLESPYALWMKIVESA